MSEWQSRAVCPNCGWHCYCSFGDAFFAKHNGSYISFCPECAESRVKSWRVEPMRWVSTSTWNPWTWSALRAANGYWESKKVLDAIGLR